MDDRPETQNDERPSSQKLTLPGCLSILAMAIVMIAVPAAIATNMTFVPMTDAIKLSIFGVHLMSVNVVTLLFMASIGSGAACLGLAAVLSRFLGFRLLEDGTREEAGGSRGSGDLRSEPGTGAEIRRPTPTSLGVRRRGQRGDSTSIVLAADQPRGVAVAEVVAPERAFFADFEYGEDENARRLMGEFAGLDLPPTRPVVIDLSGVDLINSGGFALILRWSKQSREAGRPFGLCINPAAREFFEVSRLDRVIPCFASLPEAIAGLSPESGGPE